MEKLKLWFQTINGINWLILPLLYDCFFHSKLRFSECDWLICYWNIFCRKFQLLFILIGSHCFNVSECHPLRHLILLKTTHFFSTCFTPKGCFSSVDVFSRSDMTLLFVKKRNNWWIRKYIFLLKIDGVREISEWDCLGEKFQL